MYSPTENQVIKVFIFRRKAWQRRRKGSTLRGNLKNWRFLLPPAKLTHTGNFCKNEIHACNFWFRRNSFEYTGRFGALYKLCIVCQCSACAQSDGSPPVYRQNDSAASVASVFNASEQEIMEIAIKASPWRCSSCGQANIGTLTCSKCGGPVTDERVLSLARDMAKAKPVLESAALQGNSVPIQQSVPQSWTCSYCGAQNSGNFCESCGAKRE